MKFKGLTKLALSGVALAAVAATLGTSTYAWYVSNSKAEVNNISGQSNTAAAGSLLINQLKLDGSNVTADATKWTNKIEYTNLAFKKATNLNPVTRDGAGFTPASGTATGWHDVSKTPIAMTDAVGYFFIGIKTTDSAKRTVNMYMGIQNTTETPKAQTAYTAAENVTPDGVTAGTQFFEDFVYALKFDYHFEELTAAADTTYLKNGVTVEQTTTPYTAYNAETFQNYAQNGAYSPLANAKTDGNAHAYYKALSEDYVDSNAIIGGESDNGVQWGNQSFTLPDSTKEYVLVVRYWLDGADQQCFDSCIAQSFKLSIKFETTTTA